MSADHDHSHLTETEARVRALESLLSEKGYIDPAAVDEWLIEKGHARVERGAERGQKICRTYAELSTAIGVDVRSNATW